MDLFSASKKDQAFFVWQSSYYAIWCMPLILHSYICLMIAFKFEKHLWQNTPMHV